MLALSHGTPVPYFQSKGAADFAPLFLRQPTEIARAGATLFFEGDVAKSVFRIASGNVRVCRLLPDGRRIITGFLAAGDLIGLSFRNKYLFSAEAIDDLTFSRIGKRLLEEELQLVPEFRVQLLSHLRDEITAAQDHMLLLSHKNAEQRLCTFLLQRVELAGGRDGGVLALPMVRADIADHLGMTIETVSRTLTRLVSKGVLLPADRHQFKVASRAALARAADEEPDDDDEDARERRYAGRRF
ncbi:helix-turn-helix domain-containing protein [Rhizobium sp. Rhizsp82]|uniref:helix-turn-helix domain-containing protein n=1 Tax=Rhizobium sp. Rhizsp82 TaxID=3243057 RepID=UPI0039B6034E